MKTVNSLSGGKTSSYLAAHYPADIEIFALCCIDDHNAGKGIDPAIRRAVSERLEKNSPGFGEFRATSEHPSILKTVLDLEQHIGREVVWVRGDSWETMLRASKYHPDEAHKHCTPISYIPNQQARFCTSVLKIEPIFKYLFLNGLLPAKMRIGFRYDEMERAERQSVEQHYKYASRSQIYDSGIVRTRWETFQNWRELEYPLIENRIGHYQVQQFWKRQNIVFADDSNCQFCFWKPAAQHAKNFEDAPHIMRWAALQEICAGSSFKKEQTLFEARRIGIQADFGFGGGSGCQAGFCTD